MMAPIPRSDDVSDSRTRRSYLGLLTASAGTVALAGCSDGGDDNGNGNSSANGNENGDVDPTSVCTEPSGTDPEAMLPPLEQNNDEIDPFYPSGDGHGGDIMEHTSNGESTDYDYDYYNGSYGHESDSYDAFVLEFPTGAPPSVDPDELYTVGFGDGEFDDDEIVVYVLLGDFLFIAGGPDEQMCRRLLGKFSALSEDCAEAAHVTHGASDD